MVGLWVKRDGKNVPHLVARQILGWLSILPACVAGYFYRVSVGELDPLG